MLFDLIQTDARVPTGWPGGALLDTAGSVIGITTSVGTASTGAGGFGFAIPIDLARSVADQLIATGRVTGVWLGVKGGDLDLALASTLDLTGGVVVSEVMAGSPAAEVGLAPLDTIVSLNGMPITSMGELVVALRTTGRATPSPSTSSATTSASRWWSCSPNAQHRPKVDFMSDCS